MRRTRTGFTLIELIIGIALLALLMMLAGPSYRTWILNTNIRNAAEGALTVFQTARAEAVRRNVAIEMVLTNSLHTAAAVNAIVPNAAGRNFVVRVFQPGGVYTSNDFIEGGQLIAESVPPQTTQIQFLEVAQNGGQNDADAVIFNSFGQLSLVRRGANLITTHAGVLIDVTDPTAGACVAPGGNTGTRCLRVQATRGGAARMCDPSVTDATDPRLCGALP